MRIRKSASRLLGSAYSSVPQAPAPDAAHPLEPQLAPPPMPLLAPSSAPESHAGGGVASSAAAYGETCELSRSPWDLIAELSISDPQVEDELVDKYLVSVTCRASWLLTASSMPVASAKKKKKPAMGDRGSSSQPRHDLVPSSTKKNAVSKTKEKDSEPKKRAKVMKKEQEPEEVKEPTTYKCKKNDGKQWYCRRTVSQPNSYCNYHFYQRRAHLNPEFAALVVAAAEAEADEVPKPAPTSSGPKPAGSSKPPKKKKKKPGHDLGATEGFYYYAGFGPVRSKRQCKSSSMNESVPSAPPEKLQEEGDESSAEDGSNQHAPSAAAADGPVNKATDVSSSDDNDIAGCDEESSDGDYTLGGVCGRSTKGNGEHHRDGNSKKGWKRWRKPVKARSLKSLM